MLPMILIENVPGVGKRFQVIQPDEALANRLLVKRQALWLTPLIRQRFSSVLSSNA